MKYECNCKFVKSPCVIESSVDLDAAPSGNPPFFCAFGFYGESLWKARKEIAENLQTSTNKQMDAIALLKDANSRFQVMDIYGWFIENQEKVNAVIA